jgi:subtilisin family serine protease
MKFVKANVIVRTLIFGSIVAVLSACSGGGGGAPPPLAVTPTPTPTTSSVSGTLIINGIEAPEPASRSVSNLSDADEPTSNVESPLVIGQGIISLNAEFKADGRASLQGIINRHPDLIIEVKDEVTPQGPFLVTFGNSDSTSSTQLALEALRTDSAVLAAEPVFTIQTKAVGKLEPNDSGYPFQKKALELIGMPTAWAVTVGKPSVCVAVLDDGIFAGHTDLSANLRPGYDFVSNDADPTAPTNKDTHGTHVAGTVAALGNNRFGVVGVAFKSRVVPVRVIGDGAGQFALVKAIRWAAGLSVTGVPNNLNPCRVINMSLGFISKGNCTAGPFPSIQEAVDAAEAAGVVVVAAAGNEAQACPAPQSSAPANLNNVISVAAVTPSGERAVYSNEAPTNWIAAPGGSATIESEQIASTTFTGDGAARKDHYKFMPGTSMASPHVAGVVALMLSVNPNLTPAEVRDILARTADDKGAVGRDNIFGYGIIRADKAVQAAGNTSPPAGVQLATVPSSLKLSSTQTAGKITVSNRGDQTISVTFKSGVEAEDTGGNWLAVAFPTAGATAPFDITLTADRGNLQPGIYRARVEVTTSASRVVVPVTLVVPVPGTPDIGTITVKLLNPDTNAIVASTTTNAAANYRYSMSGFPAGSYLVRAESESTGVLSYRGDYPLINSAKPVTLSGTETLAGFSVSRATSTRSLSGITGNSAPITNGILANVYDPAYGDPIANATISITDGASAKTDIYGEATFADVSGPVTITATAPGYSTQTFVDINSETIEFELELDQAGKFVVPVNLTVYIDGLVPGETGYVSAIVDGDFEEFALVNSDNPSATLSIPSGRELSIGLFANNASNVATKFNVEDFYPIYENSEVTIDARVVTATANTSSTFEGFGPFAIDGETHSAIALAYDDAGTSYIIGAQFNVPIGQPFDLSRVSLGSEQDDIIAGQIVYFADDSALTLGSYTAYTVYNTLSGLPTSVIGELPQALTLFEPMDNATVSTTSPTLRFFSPARNITPSLLAVTIEGPDEFLWEIILPPTATSFKLPTLSSGGLAAGTTYQWYVEDYVLDGFSYDDFSFEFGGFFDYNTESVTRSFKTAP